MHGPSTQSPVTANLRAAQAQSGLSNEELAQRAGVGLRLLQKWRAGDVEPRYESLLKLADALDREVSWFYEDEKAAAA
jgi:transcriptional regulator with XRE-family HTH domain